MVVGASIIIVTDQKPINLHVLVSCASLLYPPKMETGRDSYKLIWAHHVTHADDDFSRNAAVEDRLVPWVRGAGWM